MSEAMQEITAHFALGLAKPISAGFDYGIPVPKGVTVIVNPSSFRKRDEARFDRANPFLAPKRSRRRTRRRRHLFVGSHRPGYRFENVQIRPSRMEYYPSTEDFSFIEFDLSDGSPWPSVDA